jgi:hypothetical protein
MRKIDSRRVIAYRLSRDAISREKRFRKVAFIIKVFAKDIKVSLRMSEANGRDIILMQD